MKRFLLFMGHNYYPSGGWDDFVGSFDSHDEAVAVAERLAEPESGPDEDWAQIVDWETGCVEVGERAFQEAKWRWHVKPEEAESEGGPMFFPSLL